MADILSSVLRGMSFGSVYALLAIGIVLTFRTTGVFNLAFGPQAFLAAAVYYDTHVDHGWPKWLAFLLAVGIISPAVGIIFDRFLFRYLRTANETARLVAVLGLFVAIPTAITLWFTQDIKYGATGIVPGGKTTYKIMDGVVLYRDEIAIIVIGLGVLAGLMLMFRYTAIGLRMRAVVESPRLTELAGVNADRVGMFSWALSSVVAGLAGVMLSPMFGDAVSYTSFQLLVVAAIAAAVIGQLQSLPLAFAGGLALGVAQQLLNTYLPTNSVLTATLRPSLPFVVGFAVLVLSPAVARRRPPSDPLAGVDPPPPALAAAERPATLTRVTRIVGVVFCAVVGYWLFFHADSETWVADATRATGLAIIFLSIVVITGLGGQVSLCQATFALIGGATTAQLATAQGMSVLLAVVIGAVIAGVVGALLALPVLRLGGVFFALATLAFAYFFTSIVLPQGWVGGGSKRIVVPRPQVGPFDLGPGHNDAFLVLMLIVLTVVGIGVIWVRSGTTGRYLDALRGSDTAAASIGINRNRVRIVAFSLSAAIAGLGGGLLVSFSQDGTAGGLQAAFAPELGLVWVALVVTLGARTVEGAINAAVGFVFIASVVLPTWVPFAVNHLQPWYNMGALPLGIQTVLFGLGALTYARHPEGILEYNKRKSYEFMQRRFGKRSESAPPPAPDLATATAGGQP